MAPWPGGGYHMVLDLNKEAPSIELSSQPMELKAVSQGTILYRFRLSVSDVERSVYEKLDFRMALHPSESIDFLLTRMLAFSLNFGEGLAFSAKGLGDPDDPCISSENPRGGKNLWIEIGSPSARRLHKAAKAANKVKVYTYRNPELLVREIYSEKVHNAEQIEIFSFVPEFLLELSGVLKRDNEWGIIRDQGAVIVSVGDSIYQGELNAHFFSSKG